MNSDFNSSKWPFPGCVKISKRTNTSRKLYKLVRVYFPYTTEYTNLTKNEALVQIVKNVRHKKVVLEMVEIN
jgi:hypothetical protein